MYPDNVTQILDRTIERHPLLDISKKSIIQAFDLLNTCFVNKNKLLICGNGGSSSDSDHIVGELMKSFFYDRTLSDEDKLKLEETSPKIGKYLSENLQPALRSISLSAHNALNTAIANDIDSNLIFAQQVIGYGDQGDVLLGISTSGHSENIINAIITAKAMGLKTIGLTGKKGGKLKQICDVTICANAEQTPDIQELHLPIYHTICAMLEFEFFKRTI
ncbi:MAG: phosphoheptose isomerase [Candidatus Marinimicrobia bacterium]|nr:phosphoheptose isomerase [Candidatus Neomarinimicrobiota bacterium]|tara:strand:+ start:2405 stop:3061 length:657 start_codon:yes stop_codon:yes gene_type:complete